MADMEGRFNSGRMSGKACDRAGGFSLIELLVVIAIISMLVALLFPALSQARAKASSMQCVGQLKAYGQWICMYADDYGGTLPVAYASGGDPTKTMPGIVLDLYLNQYWATSIYAN